MKKTIALAIIAVFVFSLVPLAFAEDANATPKGVGKIKYLREERKELYQERREKNAERFGVFKEAKEDRKAGKTNESVVKFKEFLLKTAEQWIEELNDVKLKVQDAKELSEQQKSDILAVISSQISNLSATKAKIELAATIGQVKAIAKELREIRIDPFRRLFSLRILSARIQGHVNRAESLEKRLDAISQKAKEKGIDISAQVTSFKEKIALASDKNKQAQSKLSQLIELIKGPSPDKKQSRSLMDDVKELLKDAGKALKDAHDILKSMVNRIKSAEPKSPILETTA